jgi:hypothetical protein
VLVSAAGSPNLSDTTTAAGTYSLTGFGSGSYTITPSKSGGQNGSITSFDAARIAQFVTGNITFTPAQQIVADVSGSSGVSSFDAALIARYAASLGPPTGSTGNWIFSPPSYTHSSIVSNITDDYSALLMGDVSGNWVASGGRYADSGGPEKPASVTAPRLVTAADGEFVIPVAVQGIANKGVISYEFDLRYDPAVIQPQAKAADLAKTVSDALVVVTNAETPGLLKVVVYGPVPIGGNGILLNLRFNAVGASGSTSPLTWERMMLNEGTPRVVTGDGQVELSSAANQAEISGRILNPFGAGVSNARVTLTDSEGKSRSVISNGFGVYRFGALQPGQTYTVSAASRTLRFAPITVSLSGQQVSADLIAEP